MKKILTASVAILISLSNALFAACPAGYTAVSTGVAVTTTGSCGGGYTEFADGTYIYPYEGIAGSDSAGNYAPVAGTYCTSGSQTVRVCLLNGYWIRGSHSVASSCNTGMGTCYINVGCGW